MQPIREEETKAIFISPPTEQALFHFVCLSCRSFLVEI